MNDPFVMKAWAKTYLENKHVKFLADGSAKYTRSLSDRERAGNLVPRVCSPRRGPQGEGCKCRVRRRVQSLRRGGYPPSSLKLVVLNHVDTQQMSYFVGVYSNGIKCLCRCITGHELMCDQIELATMPAIEWLDLQRALLALSISPRNKSPFAMRSFVLRVHSIARGWALPFSILSSNSIVKDENFNRHINSIQAVLSNESTDSYRIYHMAIGKFSAYN